MKQMHSLQIDQKVHFVRKWPLKSDTSNVHSPATAWRAMLKSGVFYSGVPKYHICNKKLTFHDDSFGSLFSLILSNCSHFLYFSDMSAQRKERENFYKQSIFESLTKIQAIQKQIKDIKKKNPFETEKTKELEEEVQHFKLRIQFIESHIGWDLEV